MNGKEREEDQYENRPQGSEKRIKIIQTKKN
jgi:hypothetical protein